MTILLPDEFLPEICWEEVAEEILFLYLVLVPDSTY